MKKTNKAMVFIILGMGIVMGLTAISFAQVETNSYSQAAKVESMSNDMSSETEAVVALRIVVDLIEKENVDTNEKVDAVLDFLKNKKYVKAIGKSNVLNIIYEAFEKLYMKESDITKRIKIINTFLEKKELVKLIEKDKLKALKKERAFMALQHVEETITIQNFSIGRDAKIEAITAFLANAEYVKIVGKENVNYLKKDRAYWALQHVDETIQNFSIGRDAKIEAITTFLANKEYVKFVGKEILNDLKKELAELKKQ